MTARSSIGFDLGKATGYAVLDESGGVVLSGVHKNDRAGRRHRDYFYSFSWLVGGLLNQFPECQVSYESVQFYTSLANAHMWGGWRGILLAACRERGVEVTGYPVGTIKKHATGSGKASKDDMTAAAKKRWGIETKHDEADALWCASLDQEEKR